MAQVKKLSVATVYGKIDLKKVINSTAPIPVMDVYGLAVGTKSGDSNYGEWTALVGQFEARNPETGEISGASQLFLPEVALIPIQVAMAGEGAKSVKFAIRLTVKASQNTKPGGSPYEYSFEPLLPPTEDDPVASLRATVADQLKLPAPGDTPPADDKPADDKPANKPAAKGKGK